MSFVSQIQILEPPKIDPDVIIISSDSDVDTPENIVDKQVDTSDDSVVKTRRSKSSVIQRCETCEDTLENCSCETPKREKSNSLKDEIVSKTLSDPRIASNIRQSALLWEFLIEKFGARKPESIEAHFWLSWIIEWSETKGRCTYRDNEKGISPATAQKLFRSMVNLVERKTKINLIEKFPMMRSFVRNWQQSICKDQLYKRNQANYFNEQDVKGYVQVFDKIIETGSESQGYYALMAKNAILISVLFAGCRLGTLLDIRLGAVKFVSIDREGALQTVVAMFPGGSKTDLKNQRTSPITFGELKDSDLCPVTAFIKWLKLRGIKREGNKLIGKSSDRIFPQFRNNKLVPTGSLSKKIQDMEAKFGSNLPKFKAHTGRHTITTLALFSKDDSGKEMISVELLEHQLSWCRNTQVLPNYLGHDSVLAKDGFLDKITKFRNEEREKKLNTSAIKTFWSNTLDETLLTRLDF